MGGTPHGHYLLRSAISLSWAPTLGGAVSGGRRGPAPAGRSARAASPDVSHDAGVDAPHSPGGWGSPAGPWGPRGPAPGPQHQGGGGPPDGRSLAHSAHSQAAEKARGNRCHLGPSHKKDPRGEAAACPADPGDLERWCTAPKGHARRMQGHRPAGVRIGPQGPTRMWTLDAPGHHAGRWTVGDLAPYGQAGGPERQPPAVERGTIMRQARSRKTRSVLLADLEKRYCNAP